jgi:hypothetical protein
MVKFHMPEIQTDYNLWVRPSKTEGYRDWWEWEVRSGLTGEVVSKGCEENEGSAILSGEATIYALRNPEWRRVDC